MEGKERKGMGGKRKGGSLLLRKGMGRKGRGRGKGRERRGSDPKGWLTPSCSKSCRQKPQTVHGLQIASRGKNNTLERLTVNFTDLLPHNKKNFKISANSTTHSP